MNPRTSVLTAALCLFAPAALLAQTATTPPPAAVPASQFPDSPGVASNARPPAVATGPTIVFDTTMGRLTCQLFSKEAPISSANFIGLATGTKEWTDPATQKKVKGKPFYDGVTFHRVIPGFMIQGGDRLGTGMGDAGFFFDQEIYPGLNFDVPGRLAMANAGPNTNGSQFFITELPQPELDGKYNIFGQCDEHSVLMVATIARVNRDSQDKPVSPVVIQHVTIVPVGQPLPPSPAAPAATTPPVTSYMPPIKEPAPQSSGVGMPLRSQTPGGQGMPGGGMKTPPATVPPQ